MTHPRLPSLLAIAARQPLSPAEEAELAQLLAEPEHRRQAEKELAALRARWGTLLDYQQAIRGSEPPIPEERLARLLSGLNQAAPSAPVRVVPPRRTRRWPASLAAVGVLAAGLAVAIWYPRDAPARAGDFEFGRIAGPTRVRGAEEGQKSALGPHWREITQENLAALHAWSTAPLPDGTAARIWVDEEAQMLRARYRRNDGTIGSAATAVQANPSPAEQVRQFANSLPLRSVP